MTTFCVLAGEHMSPSTVFFSPMQPDDEQAVLALHEQVFGPGRFTRTAFRLRESAAPLLAVSLTARQDDRVIGAVSLWRIAIGGMRGALLGPLAVLDDKRGHGVGKTLLAHAVEASFAAGEPYVLLVGDLPYYAIAGFARVPFGQMVMPGPVDPARLLIALASGASMPSGKVVGVV